MMVSIRFFASIREAVGQEQIDLDIPQPSECTVTHIIEQLKADHPRTHTVLTSNTPLVAINHTMSDLSSIIRDGDEVAFFPPMTGG